MQRRGVGAMANVHVIDARREQLQADRDFTRAISMYLKDRRARFERQLVGHFKKNQKRLELVRLARASFRQESTSIREQYLRQAVRSARECQGLVDDGQGVGEGEGSDGRGVGKRQGSADDGRGVSEGQGAEGLGVGECQGAEGLGEGQGAEGLGVSEGQGAEGLGVGECQASAEDIQRGAYVKRRRLRAKQAQPQIYPLP